MAPLLPSIASATCSGMSHWKRGAVGPELQIPSAFARGRDDVIKSKAVLYLFLGFCYASCSSDRSWCGRVLQERTHCVWSAC